MGASFALLGHVKGGEPKLSAFCCAFRGEVVVRSRTSRPTESDDQRLLR
jgi:hypothetical protein